MNKIIALLTFVMMAFAVVSCDEKKYDNKDNLYAEKHKLYSTKDTVYTNITVYYANVKGHDVVYHVFSGKNKSQMEVWHFENECAKCKKQAAK